MTQLPNDVSRCLGQHDSGQDCAHKDQCARYVQRATRGERTPTTWHLCAEGGPYVWQISTEQPA